MKPKPFNPGQHAAAMRPAGTSQTETRPDGTVVKKESNYAPEIFATCAGIAVIVLSVFVGLGRIEATAMVPVIGAIGSIAALWKVSQKAAQKVDNTLTWVAIAIAGLGLIVALGLGGALLMGVDFAPSP